MADSAAVEDGLACHRTCVKCAADVTRLPAAARFCNRCGAPLAAAVRFEPPRILVAYARALFNLGWRYETAVGSRRNLEEAARCYRKAARLGDAPARIRSGQSPGVDDPLAPVPPFAIVYAPPPAPDHC